MIWLTWWQKVVLLTTKFHGIKHFSTLSINMKLNIYRKANHLHPVAKQRACAIIIVLNFLWKSLPGNPECKLGIILTESLDWWKFRGWFCSSLAWCVVKFSNSKVSNWAPWSLEWANLVTHPPPPKGGKHTEKFECSN